MTQLKQADRVWLVVKQCVSLIDAGDHDGPLRVYLAMVLELQG